MEKLSLTIIQTELEKLAGWTIENQELVKQINFKSFPKAISFVTEIAFIAEKQNHHPSIKIDYSKIELRISTHDAGGITQLDFKLIHAIEKILTVV